MRESLKRTRPEDEQHELPDAKKKKAPITTKQPVSKPAAPSRQPAKATTSKKPKSIGALSEPASKADVPMGAAITMPVASTSSPTPEMEPAGPKGDVATIQVETARPQVAITRLPDLDEEDRLAASLGEAIASSLMDEVEDEDTDTNSKPQVPPPSPPAYSFETPASDMIVDAIATSAS